MDNAQLEALPLRLTIVIAGSLVVLVYVFLRMAGVLGRRRRDHPPRGQR